MSTTRKMKVYQVNSKKSSEMVLSRDVRFSPVRVYARKATELKPNYKISELIFTQDSDLQKISTNIKEISVNKANYSDNDRSIILQGKRLLQSNSISKFSFNTLNMQSDEIILKRVYY